LLSIPEANSALEGLAHKDKFEKLLHTAAILTDVLLQHDIQPIVVEGLSVEVFTLSGYSTEDIDFVLTGYEKTGEIKESRALDFRKRQGVGIPTFAHVFG